MGQGVEGSRGRSPVGPLGGIFRGPRKTAILPLFLAPEANFDCKNTMILSSWGSLGASSGRVNKMSDSLERNQRFCCGAGGVKGREEECQNGEVCNAKARRRFGEQVNL